MGGRIRTSGKRPTSNAGGGGREDKRARRRSWTKKNDGDRQRIEKHVDEESRAEQSKTKSTRWKKQMKARDRKGTGKQSWNLEKRDKTEKAKQKNGFNQNIYIWLRDRRGRGTVNH